MENKKIWVVLVDVRTADLETKLNELADEEYTVHSVVRQVNDTWTVLAYDTTQIMKKQTAAMTKQMLDLGVSQSASESPFK